MQPMGLQVSLQAQQIAAQTALTNAQAEKIRSETTAQKVDQNASANQENDSTSFNIRTN